ncbi:hypothetical protein TYRP_002224 [Tyrophagus putrescentiae]|nr:hypothetical protein TYRP_002224 [Tyrophagus putrescentiae]
MPSSGRERQEEDSEALLRSTGSDHDSDSTAELANPINQDPVPRDKFYLCHGTFFLIGLAQLLPWNFLVTATNYWMFKFRHLNGTVDYSTYNDKSSSIIADEDKSDLQAVFDSYLAIASNLPFLINAFLRLTLILVFFLNMVASFIQANFAGLASLLPNQIMHLMVTGQAMSGLFAVIAQILSLAGNWSIVQSTFVYFVFADTVILGTLVIYFITTRTRFFQYHNALANFESESTDSGTQQSSFDLSAFKIVFEKMWPYCLTLMLTFLTSLSVFPAVVVLVSPSAGHQTAGTFWTGKFFLPVCCFLIFNLCDFLGRYLGRFGLLPRHRSSSLITIAVLRMAFIPVFMLTNVHPRRHLPVLFASEYYYILYMVLFGLSNGYLVINVFVNGPLSVPPAYRKLSGFFLMLFLGLGLTLGSLSSTVLVRIL